MQLLIMVDFQITLYKVTYKVADLTIIVTCQRKVKLATH